MSAAERRKLFLDVARRTFLESDEGIAGVSVCVIADRSGIDEALVYRHFGTKENLYFEAVTALIDAVIDGLMERARQFSVGEHDVDRERREWDLTHEFVVEILQAPPEILRVAGLLLFGERGRAAAFYERSVAPTIRSVEQVVESELPNWRHTSFAPSLVVRVALATALLTAVEADLTGTAPDPEGTARALTELIFYGTRDRVIGPGEVDSRAS